MSMSKCMRLITFILTNFQYVITDLLIGKHVYHTTQRKNTEELRKLLR